MPLNEENLFEANLFEDQGKKASFLLICNSEKTVISASNLHP